MKKSYWITIAILGTGLILILMVGSILFGIWNNVGWGMMGVWPAVSMHGWALTIFGFVWLVRSFPSNRWGSPIINQQENSQTSTREILQIRYASGDITRDQYLQMLDDIE
jgi:uncharacterized membrane protein